MKTSLRIFQPGIHLDNTLNSNSFSFFSVTLHESRFILHLPSLVIDIFSRILSKISSKFLPCSSCFIKKCHNTKLNCIEHRKKSLHNCSWLFGDEWQTKLDDWRVKSWKHSKFVFGIAVKTKLQIEQRCIETCVRGTAEDYSERELSTSIKICKFYAPLMNF